MAITILEQPGDKTTRWSPAYNPLWLVFSSDQTAQPDFSYVVYVKDGSGTTLVKLKILPDPNGRCVVDIHKHLESLVSYDLDLTDLSVNQSATNSRSNFNITVAEEYLSGGSITEFNSTNLDEGTVWNGVVGWVEQNDFDFIPYTKGALGGQKLFTSIPTRGYEVKLNSKTYINFYRFLSPGNITIKAYTGAGLDWTETVANTGSYRMAIGPANINNADDLSGTNFLTESHTYYTVQIDDDNVNAVGSGNPGSALLDLQQVTSTTATFHTTAYSPSDAKVGDELVFSGFTPSGWNGTYGFAGVERYPEDAGWLYTITKDSIPAGAISVTGTYGLATRVKGYSKLYRFDLNHECSPDQEYQLIFRDRLGSMVSIMFDRVSTKSGSIKKDYYRKQVGGYSGDRVQYNSYDRAKTVLDTIVTEKIKVRSNWITEQQSALIDEMLASPITFHLMNDGTLLAIDILTSNYTTKKRRQEKIFNYELEFEYSFLTPQSK